MPSNYSTPDVYVEEISTLPPSVAEVSTAIPAFIGYTENVVYNAKNLTNVPTRIGTLLEYKMYFGGPDTARFTVALDDQGNISSVVADAADTQHKLYYALDHFFKNGGSNCYVVSVGAYGTKQKADFKAGLDAVAKEDEPTLIILSEAATLAVDDYYELCNLALLQCADLKDRFCIFDVLPGSGQVEIFRQKISANNLKYGAAYYPYLNTSLNYIYEETDITVTGLPDPADQNKNQPAGNVVFTKDLGGVKASYSGAAADTPLVEVQNGSGTKTVAFTIANKKLTIANVGANGKPGTVVLDAWTNWTDPSKVNFTLEIVGDGSQDVDALAETALTTPKVDPKAPAAGKSSALSDIKKTQTGIYNSIKQELSKLRVVLPPAPAVAGVYAATDRERGVWKAPANVSLNAVISPTVKITANDQEKLNIDENGGKSINAIRSFYGKGTLVWGARTLAGNDNEWRFVPVRRLFNMIEESAKKASYFAVFEPNDGTTWLKVKGMIDSYLYGLWQQGALAGSSPKAAYYVNVGLGTTMTQDDILAGRLIIEIGIAAVRPAEFMILRFSHKLQEA